MIEKFKKGGLQKQLQTSILALIQLLPEALQKQILLAFSQWALQKGLDINLLQLDLNALEEALGMFMLELQSLKALSARHGAKLNYLRTLKNKCAEDEEVYYFKKGGIAGCGCRKKEDDGEINKAQKGTAVSNFKKEKNKKKEINPNDTVQYRGKAYDITAKESPEKSNSKNIGPTGYQRLSKLLWREMEKTKEGMAARERVEEKDEKTGRKESGGKLKKDCGGGFVKKFKAAKCGTKMKKHQFGGWMNLKKVSTIADKPKVIELPEVTVTARSPYRFDRRVSNIGPGYNVISDVIYDEYDGNGNYWGDLSGIMGGRTIYETPYRNDTIYGGRQAYYLNDPQEYNLLKYPHGYMEIPKNTTNLNNKNGIFIANLKTLMLAQRINKPMTHSRELKKGLKMEVV